MSRSAPCPFRIVLALAAFMALAGAAASETARVRSGDHPDRSRLVVELAEPTGWRLGRVEGGYAIELARPGIGFDLSQVFRLISRKRIAGVDAAAGASRLTIRTGCDCHALVTEFNDSWIVIDIADGPAPHGSPFETAFAPFAPAPAAEPAPAPDTGLWARPSGTLPQLLPGLGDAMPGVRSESTLSDPVASEPLPVDLPFPDLAGAPVRPAGVPASDRSARPNIMPPPDRLPPATTTTAAPAEGDGAAGRAPDDADAIVAQEAALLEELARAAAQGLVEAHLPTLDRLEDRQAAHAEPAPAPEPPPETHAGPEAQVRLRAETSIDRDAGASSPRRMVTDGGVACLPDEALDLAAWGGGEDPAAGIAARRARLVGEFDRPDPGAVRDLVRYYLHLGFGAEARATLAAFGTQDSGADVLRAMAAVVDGSDEGLPGALAAQTSCNGAAALWSLLAEKGPHPGDAPDGRAAAAAFSALPLSLRRSLGPDLAARFLAVGDTDTALRLRNAIARAGGEGDDRLDLLDARLALAEDDPRAPGALAELLDSDDETATAAYRTYLETELAAGRAPPDADETAAALAFEWRGTAEGAALEELSVRSLAAGGEYDAARAAIRRLGRVDPGAETRLWPVLAVSLARDAPDGVFLAQMFAARDAMSATPFAPDLALMVAARLTGLGFGDEALRYLPEHGDEAMRPARDAAWLTQGIPERTLAELAALEGAAVSRSAAGGHAQDAGRAAFIAGNRGLPRDSAATAPVGGRVGDDHGEPDPDGAAGPSASAGTPDSGKVAAARAALAAADATRTAAEGLLSQP